MAKKRIPRDKLHALLVEEYARTAGDLCTACRLPLPSYFAAAKEGPNWRLPPMEECNALCHTIAADVAARMAQRYDLLP